MRNTIETVFGIYRDRTNLERAVDQLKSEGFGQSDISVMFPDQQSTQEFAKEKHTKAPEGAAAGAGTGMAIGGTLGWLASIGTLAIPGVGPLIAAGPIMAALAGAGVGGAIGTLSGALIGMGIPEHEAKHYESAVKSGGFVLSVHSDRPDLINKSREVLHKTGAEQVSGTGETYPEYQGLSQGRTPGLPQERETSLDSKTQEINLKPGEEVIIGKDKIEKKKTA